MESGVVCILERRVDVHGGGLSLGKHPSHNSDTGRPRLQFGPGQRPAAVDTLQPAPARFQLVVFHRRFHAVRLPMDAPARPLRAADLPTALHGTVATSQLHGDDPHGRRVSRRRRVADVPRLRVHRRRRVQAREQPAIAQPCGSGGVARCDGLLTDGHVHVVRLPAQSARAAQNRRRHRHGQAGA